MLGFSGQGITEQKSGKVLSLKSIHRRNHFGETKLHLAVMKGDIQDVKELITMGASVNIPDYAGMLEDIIRHKIVHYHYCIVLEDTAHFTLLFISSHKPHLAP